MRVETLSFFEEVIWKQRRPLSDLLNSRFTFVTPRLARHYGLKLGASESESNDFTRVEFGSDSGRGGLLTHGSLLTIGGDEASMVTRGLFVMNDVLRGVVRDPPPCVDTTPVPTKPGLTNRLIALQRIADTSCGGCHSKFEPLAFGLEKFDGVGGYHEQDQHGNPLRDDGQILFPGDAKPIQYASSSELMNLLAANERVKQTLTWKVTQFCVGRPLTAADARTMEQIHARSQQAGGTYQSLIRSIILSDLIQKTKTVSE